MRHVLTVLTVLALLTASACEVAPEYGAEDAHVIELEEIAQTPQVQPPPPGGPAAVPVARQLIKTGAVTVRAADHGAAVARTRALAEAAGGFVGDERSARYADRVETTLTLRVPAARFDTLLAAVSALPGTVESREVSVDDVTRQVADVEARLAARRAAEAQFLSILERAGSIEDVLAVQVELQRVREEIESAEAQLRALRDQVALSTLRVTVFEASAAGITAGPGFFARAGRAAAAGWDGLLALALALVAAWPLVVGAALVAWWARRRGWRVRLRRTGDRGPTTGEAS